MRLLPLTLPGTDTRSGWLSLAPFKRTTHVAKRTWRRGSCRTAIVSVNVNGELIFGIKISSYMTSFNALQTKTKSNALDGDDERIKTHGFIVEVRGRQTRCIKLVHATL